MPMSCASGHKTSKLKVNASYTRPKSVGMLSSSILAFKRAIYELPARPDFDFAGFVGFVGPIPTCWAARAAYLRQYARGLRKKICDF